MSRRKARNTRGKIIEAAWRLFYEQGYDDTTVEEIIEASGTSRGSFYHYFEGKDTLLSSLSYLFDEQYEELAAQLDPAENRLEGLLWLNRQLFTYIENRVSMELLGRLLSSQLITKGDKHLLDHHRTYYRLLRRLAAEGQERGDIRADVTVGEFVKGYALMERALLYDWCLCGGEYALAEYSGKLLKRFLQSYAGQPQPLPGGESKNSAATGRQQSAP